MDKTLAKQTFDYLVSFYNMKRVPIFYTTEKGNKVIAAVWDIEKDGIEMKTFNNGGRLVYFNDSMKDMLKEWAYEQIEDTIEIYKKLTSKDIITIAVGEYLDYELSKTIVWGGTRDEIFEKYERANDRLRYCNGHYYSFVDEEENRLNIIWYHMNSYWRNFHIYYGGGIVD